MLRLVLGVLAFLWGLFYLVWPLPEPEMGPGIPSIYIRLLVFVALVVIGLDFSQPSVVKSWRMLPLAVRLLPSVFFGLMIIADIATTGFRQSTLTGIVLGLKLVEIGMTRNAQK